MSEIKGKLVVKASNGKGFKVEGDEGWFNASSEELLKSFNKGDEVVATYEKKCMQRNVTKIVSAVSAPAEAPKVVSATGFACNVCGASLKNDKFKTCYVCNQKGLKPKETVEASKEETKVSTKSYSSYDNPAKSAQIQRGNALNAAAAVAGGQAFNDPDTAAEFTLIVAQKLLDWLRIE